MIINANALNIPLADKSAHCVVTSPPYWGLRDYGVGGQLGLERTPEEYVANMVAVFREVWRVLRDDGTLWLNLGDSYATNQAGNTTWGNGVGTNKHYQNGDTGLPDRKPPPGLKPKDLVGIPWRVAFALQADGWYLRSDIIWSKPNPMPESVTDRPTKAHEYLFLLAKSQRYYYDADAVREGYPDSTLERLKYPHGKTEHSDNGWANTKTTKEQTMIIPNPAGRNRRTVWTIPTAPYKGAHFATYPPALVEPCIKAGCPEGGIVFDPFCGSGTTLMVAGNLGRRGVGLDLNFDYLSKLTKKRVNNGHTGRLV